MRKTIITILAATLIYLVTCLLLLKVPLFNILGYEFSLTFAFVSYFVSGIGVILVHGFLKTDSKYNRAHWYALSSITLSSVPLLFMTVRGFFITNCNYFQGLYFYLLLAFVSSLFGGGLGFMLANLVKKNLWKILTFVAVSFFILLKVPYDLLYTPNVNLYNHLFGYFAGPIYDEILAIYAPLVIYRSYTLLISFTLFLLGNVITALNVKGIKKFPIKKSLLISLLIAGIVLFNLNSETLGFKSNSKTITQKLSATKNSDHFIFHYAKEDEEIMGEISGEFEFRYHQNEKSLNVILPEKISVFIYPNAEIQRKIMGSGGVFISKPSANQIHMVRGDPYRLPIKHELVHIMAGQFGFPILKISTKIGLLEGLATAVERYRGPMTFHEYAKALKELKLLPEIKGLLGFGFWTKQSARAYYASGSFCSYLIDKYGMEDFKKIYRGSSFKNIYNKNIEDLEKDWMKRIDAIKLSKSQIRLAESIFKPKGIFAKSCAHEVARLVEKARNCKNCTRKEGPALDILNDALRLSGYSPDVQRRLIQKFYDFEMYSKAEKTAQDLKNNDKAPPFFRAEAFRIDGNCKILDRKRKGALISFHNITSLIYNDFFAHYILLNEVKMRLLKNRIHLNLVKKYLKETDIAKKVDILDDFATNIHENENFNLLIAKIYHDQKSYTKSVDYLQRIRKHPNVYLENYRRILFIKNYFDMKEWEKGKTLINSYLKENLNDALKFYYKDWLERIEFTKRQRVL